MIDKTKYINFSRRLQSLRTERGINQVEIAKILGVTKQSISNWENDNIMPSVEMIVKIATFFSVSTDYLLGLDNKKYIETTGLTDTQILHLQQIADDLIKSKGN